jgi:hypothetical protein
MADPPVHEAEEYQAATIRNVFGSEGCVDDVDTPVSPNAPRILAPQTSSACSSGYKTPIGAGLPSSVELLCSLCQWTPEFAHNVEFARVLLTMRLVDNEAR